MATDCNNKGIYPSIKGKKRKIAEKLASPEFDGNISNLCKEYKIARSTLYRWYDDACFKGYVEWLIERYTDTELANAWRALIKRANCGNIEALKLFFALKDKYKQDINVNNNAVIIVDDLNG